MLKIGLTGNIGSGKTTVAGIFNILGVDVYHADTEAKKFLQYLEVIEKLKGNFGDKIITNHTIDKIKLANLVFNDKLALNFLNQTIHPYVKTDFEQWMTTLNPSKKYVVQEAAILFESGFDKYVDKTILVTAPQSIRMQRVTERDNISEAMFLQRDNNQWPEERKIEMADYVIVNDDTISVIPQIIELHSKLLKLK
ncbi:MAG: dephospho-CoA kinase [Bacteroidetes bacterium]|nr:dephospho-CoA kinase [Bacteroidota bacterium]